MKKAKKANRLQIVEKLVNELLPLLGTKAKATITSDTENEAIKIQIETKEEMGLLIGHHGETLNSLQLIFGMMVKQKLGEWVRIIVDIGDWREKQEEHLKELARQVAQRAKQTRQPQPIYNLTPSQRRIIHLELSKEKEIETESTGEGENRYLVVKCK
jgi:spoIIIJ-associated protein